MRTYHYVSDPVAAPSVWYVAYGSNLALDRFRSYLCGGRPRGGRRAYPGCRDTRAPTRLHSLQVPGGLVFAGDSTVWGGGMAFFDRAAPGWIACRAYLIAVEQFADLTAQEMRRPPGGEFARDLEDRLGEVPTLQTLGHGLYESIVRLGVYEGSALLTVTHGDVADLTPAAPSAAYLSQIATGLLEAHGWDPATIAAYLVQAPGVRGRWTEDAIADLAKQAREVVRRS